MVLIHGPLDHGPSTHHLPPIYFIDYLLKYREINLEVNKFIRNQKRQYIKNQLTKAEEDSVKNNIRECYKKIKYFQKGFIPKTTGVKNKKGEIISDKKKQY